MHFFAKNVANVKVLCYFCTPLVVMNKKNG